MPRGAAIEPASQEGKQCEAGPEGPQGREKLKQVIPVHEERIRASGTDSTAKAKSLKIGLAVDQQFRPGWDARDPLLPALDQSGRVARAGTSDTALWTLGGGKLSRFSTQQLYSGTISLILARIGAAPSTVNDTRSSSN